MGGALNPEKPEPYKRNRHTFSSTKQPTALQRSTMKATMARNKFNTRPSIAKQAFADMGFNPIETQIRMAQKYEQMLGDGVGWSGAKISKSETTQFCQALMKLSAELTQYQTVKATVASEAAEREEELNPTLEESTSRPLSASELMNTRRSVPEESLSDKIG